MLRVACSSWPPPACGHPLQRGTGSALGFSSEIISLFVPISPFNYHKYQARSLSPARGGGRRPGEASLDGHLSSPKRRTYPFYPRLMHHHNLVMPGRQFIQPAELKGRDDIWVDADGYIGHFLAQKVAEFQGIVGLKKLAGESEFQVISPRIKTKNTAISFRFITQLYPGFSHFRQSIAAGIVGTQMLIGG